MTGQPDFLNSFDGCYLPDGRIVFSSTAGHKGVPCEDGGGITQSLFLLGRDRKNVRRLTFDQDHDWHPNVANDGRILYTRWDYTDAHHYYARLLFGMNPDGSGQMALYGSNSYFPNGKLYSRSVPWHNEKVITVELGHVEPIGRFGRLMLLDLARGQKEQHGVIQTLPRSPLPLESHANYVPIRDFSAPRFTEPWPLADAKDPRGAGKYFLASVKLTAATPAEIYLVDVFDNMVLIAAERDWHLREPVPLRSRYKPRAIPDRVDPSRSTGAVNLVPIPSGTFVMGDEEGYPDEKPRKAKVEKSFWMARTEITNAQFALFDPTHYSGYFDNLGKNNERKGKPLNQPEQPVIRVSYRQAQAFCQWLSQRTQLEVRLPTEQEWEYACRAGADTPMHYGPMDADFSQVENLADRALLEKGFFFPVVPLQRRRSGMRYMATPFALDNRYSDGMTSPDGTGLLEPNAWGLMDMHGNVQEWTSSLYEDGSGGPDAKRVVKGGSWMDRPADARAGIRRGYQPWRRVHNVGFCIVVQMPRTSARASDRP